MFIVLRILPGDPVSAILGGAAKPWVIEQQREKLGLNRPITVQYVDYLRQICRLNFGKSMVFNQEVTEAIATKKLPATLELAVFGMLIALFLGVFAGARAADKRRSVQDYLFRLFGIVGFCIPVYWLGLMFQLIFGVWLHLLPIAGRTSPRVLVSTFDRTGFYLIDTILLGDWAALGDVFLHLLMPAFAMGLLIAAVFVRLTRANMLEILRADYIIAAEARGIKHRTIVYKHALKNASVPILTMMGLQFAALMAGSVLIESTFSWPGMGRLLLESIFLRDYPMIQGVIVFYALVVSIVSLIVDLIYALVDPRVRF